MSRFEQRKRAAMRDPEFRAAYEEADIEVRLREVLGPYVQAANSGTCVQATTINFWAPSLSVPKIDTEAYHGDYCTV